MQPNEHKDHYAQLNNHIKTDLLASQRFLSDIKKVHPELHNSGTCKPSNIKIRDRINFFEVIQPHADLTDQEITLTLERWLVMMRYHRIILLFNDNATDIRERYQFIIDEFLEMELPPHPPEMQFCFIYDRIMSQKAEQATDQLVNCILQPLLNTASKGDFQHLSKRVRLNDFDNLSEPELHYLVDRYQQRFEKIINRSFVLNSKKLVGNRLVYQGRHQTGFCFQDHCNIIRGTWQIELIPTDGEWFAVDIQIEGIEF
jgi:hypothetical protein